MYRNELILLLVKLSSAPACYERTGIRVRSRTRGNLGLLRCKMIFNSSVLMSLRYVS